MTDQPSDRPDPLPDAPPPSPAGLASSIRRPIAAVAVVALLACIGVVIWGGGDRGDAAVAGGGGPGGGGPGGGGLTTSAGGDTGSGSGTEVGEEADVGASYDPNRPVIRKDFTSTEVSDLEWEMYFPDGADPDDWMWTVPGSWRDLAGEHRDHFPLTGWTLSTDPRGQVTVDGEVVGESYDIVEIGDEGGLPNGLMTFEQHPEEPGATLITYEKP